MGRSKGEVVAEQPPPSDIIEEMEDKPSTSGSKNNSLGGKKLAKLKEKYEKRGIVYISRLPPHMVRDF